MVQVTDFNLNNFMSELKGGARPNQFKAELVVPAKLKNRISNSGLAQQKMKFMIKSANLPASQLGVIEQPFRGRQFKLEGDRTFPEWTVSVVNDVDFQIRDVFEEWMDLIVGNVNHDQYDDVEGPVDYMSSGDVHQLDRNGKIIKTYKFIGMWPSLNAEVALDWGSNDQIEEFPVTFQYQWWESNTTRNNTGADKFARSAGAPIIGPGSTIQE